jgi:hypothetical protein
MHWKMDARLATQASHRPRISRQDYVTVVDHFLRQGHLDVKFPTLASLAIELGRCVAFTRAFYFDFARGKNEKFHAKQN